MAIYVSSTYQYIILAIIFSKGKPYRKSMFTNCKSHTEYVGHTRGAFIEEH
ncbi:hypothetical protein DPMN_105930 [Dreissena polymorpha]|uniref:Uncharacterized protein n=1 Tax=Dreissena polymorpha TaxID=45954 RepID=A0A9D4K428_DREPO|nr:hypothetical protein DPMN_105930 [Dreissena polymorpha]